jgi:hypothetical protein
LVFKVEPYPASLRALLLAALITLAAFSLALVTAVPMRTFKLVGGATLLLAGCMVPAYLTAWPMPHTTLDLLFFCLFGLGLVVIASVAWSNDLINRKRVQLRTALSPAPAVR